MLKTSITVPFVFPKTIIGIVSDTITNIPIGVRYKKFGTTKTKLFYKGAKNEYQYFDHSGKAIGLKIYQKQSPIDPTPHSLTLYNSEQSTTVSWDPHTPAQYQLQNFMVLCRDEFLRSAKLNIVVVMDDGFITDIAFLRDGIVSGCNNNEPIDVTFPVLLFLFIILLALHGRQQYKKSKKKRKSLAQFREVAKAEVASW